MNPPVKAAVFAVNEKPQIQALDRTTSANGHLCSTDRCRFRAREAALLSRLEAIFCAEAPWGGRWRSGLTFGSRANGRRSPTRAR